MFRKLLFAAGLAIAGVVVSPVVSPVLAQVAQPTPHLTDPVSLDALSANISNGLINAKIYLIDLENGFYTGTRFDQAGVVGSLTLDGQEFYGPWFDRFSRQVMDFTFTPEGVVAGQDSGISGPVEEFAPIGYDQVAPGGSFTKIGVGVLKKPDAKPYDHYHIYEITDGGQRNMVVTGSGVSFTQEVAGNFRYVKSLRLVQGKPQLLITHELTNLGAKPISTDVYDHNFLKLSPGNENIAVTLPFAVKPDTAPDPAIARIVGNRISYVRPLAGSERVSFLISGFGKSADDYDIKVENIATGAGMEVVGDQPLVKMNLWSIRTVMAVEPYIAIELRPGQTKRWTYTYTYKAKTR